MAFKVFNTFVCLVFNVLSIHSTYLANRFATVIQFYYLCYNKNIFIFVIKTNQIKVFKVDYSLSMNLKYVSQNLNFPILIWNNIYIPNLGNLN